MSCTHCTVQCSWTRYNHAIEAHRQANHATLLKYIGNQRLGVVYQLMIMLTVT